MPSRRAVVRIAERRNGSQARHWLREGFTCVDNPAMILPTLKLQFRGQTVLWQQHRMGFALRCRAYDDGVSRDSTGRYYNEQDDLGMCCCQIYFTEVPSIVSVRTRCTTDMHGPSAAMCTPHTTALANSYRLCGWYLSNSQMLILSLE